MFVVYNIMQCRQTTYNAHLAVNCSWFPQVDALFNMISESTIREYSEKLKTNPFACPESDGEKAAAKLMKYVNYVGDHLPGSIAEIQSMREEMFLIVNTNGLPYVFLTLNPSDTHSPIAQVLAGRNVDLDKFFHDLKPTVENLERSAFILLNPVAEAEFFHICVKNMLEILLGTGRESRKGVFGEVEVYYGVVEAQG
ncbi:atp-dependent dna helicase pif1 [Moniliophthora roreri]|nr:atp-dependent dna helicase pif1 [Moniliophthora roreri]